MMPMHFSYPNQHLYRPAMFPNYAINYSPYYPSFYPNSDGLLPTPPRQLMVHPLEKNLRDCKVNLPNNSFIKFSNENNNIDSNNFLTFIEQKTKPISELNPFANEFSVVKNNNNNNNQIITANKENNSSYKLIYDDLIEQSLQYIETMKKASKTVSVNDVSTQYDQFIDQINRSTQTHDDNAQYTLLKEYSLHTVKLMNRILADFKYLLLVANENNLRYQLKDTNHLCNELQHLILIMNQIITSSNKSSINKDNMMDEEFTIQSSPIMFDVGRQMHRLISSSSISHSSTPTFSSSPRQIDPITIVRSKVSTSYF
ncbi:unnamed protein product [Adineta steineri]|uniref:Uncharacterized protein n=1 Tax=Adineta steineri TaxID=433720 RepID=A0A816E842_9BILA|nr:unnamed protein product [Adineta steineri]CAF1649030.1 unnamed protein product [Adineta steineri]